MANPATFRLAADYGQLQGTSISDRVRLRLDGLGKCTSRRLRAPIRVTRSGHVPADHRGGRCVGETHPVKDIAARAELVRRPSNHLAVRQPRGTPDHVVVGVSRDHVEKLLIPPVGVHHVQILLIERDRSQKGDLGPIGRPCGPAAATHGCEERRCRSAGVRDVDLVSGATILGTPGCVFLFHD